MSKLLINDRPIMILPKLAVKIGLNESIMLQQVHYWLQTSSHEKEGRYWVFNTYQDWQEQLPFWSLSTIKRTIKHLEELGLLHAGNYNQLKLDKTKWYSIDYENLAQYEDDGELFLEHSKSQNESQYDSKGTPEDVNLNKAIPESTTEITSKTSTYSNIPFSEIISYLNEKTKSSFRPNTKKTKELIHARYNEGYTIEDFKRVIDLKTTEWLHDPNWSKYLRPETLFGTKFESYLNQKAVKNPYSEEDFNLDD